MKKVKIEWKKFFNPGFYYSDITGNFAWLNPDGKDKFKQVSKWNSCREETVGELARYHRKANSGIKEIDLKKTRMAIYFVNGRTSSIIKANAEHRACMKESIRLLNIMEKSQGWALSKVYECYDATLPRMITFVFISSPKWIQAPQLLSLYLLTIRLGRLRAFTQTLKKLSDTTKVARAVSKLPVEDRSYVISRHYMRVYRYLDKVLNNHQKLFFTRSAKTNFTINGFTDGIYHLMSGKADKVMLMRWKQIIQEK